MVNFLNTLFEEKKGILLLKEGFGFTRFKCYQKSHIFAICSKIVQLLGSF